MSKENARGMRDDVISRQQVINALERAKQNIRHNIERAIGKAVCEILDEVENGIKQLPSAEEESFEWCTDCKEYDQEQHCCHRYSKVIRQAFEEMKVVHCIDCRHSEYDEVYKDRYCHYNGKAEVVDDYHFCRDGERKDDE